jgi:AraC-like DNA-binding protein
MLLRVIDFVASRGHDARALCRSVGLHEAALRMPGARVPYELAHRLNTRAVELTRDPHFGLRLAEDVREPRLQGLDTGLLMLMASDTVGTALERMVKYQRFWGDGERSRLVQLPGARALRYHLSAPHAVTQRHSDECALAEVMLGLNALAERPVSARAARFRHAAPSDRSRHAAVFSCPLEFGSAHTELIFDDVALRTPMRHAHAFYAEIFRQQVEHEIAQLPSAVSVTLEVRGIVGALLPSGVCTLASTARALGLSARTLQRRLQGEGSSFDALVDRLRHELSLHYLDQQLPVREITELLGYTDPRAFHYAFKRWTGSTPERLRAARAQS